MGIQSFNSSVIHIYLLKKALVCLKRYQHFEKKKLGYTFYLMFALHIVLDSRDGICFVKM